tara:strand:- start:1439 stop:2065 length:627 start_codon:yes stop_codon:yes gene_type:complete
MRVLELFSGTGSISKICDELDWECVSVDINDNYDTPTIMTDVMTWNYKEDFPTGYFDLITASPPCHTFSQLRRSWIGKKLKYFGDVIVTKEMLDKDMIDTGVPILLKAREIIDFYKPKSFWIENPKSSKMKDFITDLPYGDTAYCQYGYSYQKNTRFWNNFDFKGKKCNHKKHSIAVGQGTHGLSLADKYSLPPELVRELLIASLNNM